MASNRRTLERVYNHCYKRVDYTHCAYCGDAHQCYDHVPALTWMGSMGSSYFIDKGVQPLLVPSCLECNAILGSVGVFDIDERRAYIAGELRDRYKWAARGTDALSMFIKCRIAFADQCYLPINVVEPRPATKPKPKPCLTTWGRVSEPVQLYSKPKDGVGSESTGGDALGITDLEAAAILATFKELHGIK